MGGFEARLNTFPPIAPLVVGAFGEWSPAVDGVLMTLAKMPGRWTCMRAAERALLSIMRRELGTCGLRGHARLLSLSGPTWRMGAPGQRGRPPAACSGPGALGHCHCASSQADVLRNPELRATNDI